MAERAATRRFSTLLAGVFAGAAVVLAAIGLFGLISYGVAQRRRELAIRLALGASPRSVASLVVRQGLRLAGIGALLGLLGALGGGRLASRLLFQVGPADPQVLAAVAGILIAVALAASWLPARRAARVAPLEALREE
jgi:ABC-type antimicrobial peptide transport system permease subunit